MKILILTQSLDRTDPVLGFFHTWVESFAKNFERVTVICLKKGEYDLAANVKVLSLGKERGGSKLTYLFNFYKFIWLERKNYDVVFVHMNQEYVILGWKSWFLLGKKIYLWRNHKYGNMLTTLGAKLSRKVFYTSPGSFTARFKNAVQMPVGVDTEFFRPDPSVLRIPNSILFLGRISPVKKVLEFLDWVYDKDYLVTIAGPILAEDQAYGEKVKKRLNDRVKYIGPVTQEEARRLYQSHEIYMNKTPRGSFDKTILEAKACGAKVISDNEDAGEINVEAHSLKALMEKLKQEL